MTGRDLDRKRRGVWYTPEHLVEAVVAAVIDEVFVAERRHRPIRVLDPACGDGRFLHAAGRAIRDLGGAADLVGVDIDPLVVASIGPEWGVTALCADALDGESILQLRGGSDGSSSDVRCFDLVIGNPPYLSQMSSATTRGGTSSHGGGPYADAAAEFLALGAACVDPDGGRLAYVLPQSILSARDAGDVRRSIDGRARMFWSTWTGERDFDAQVVTCAVAFEFGRDLRRDRVHRERPSRDETESDEAERDGTKRDEAQADRTGGADADERVIGNWSYVVTGRSGVPAMPDVFEEREPRGGRLGDRARLNANFRDEYYGMIPAVDDHTHGPPLITSGLIDPGVCRWGTRPVKFAKHRFAAPRIDVSRLDEKMTRWALQRLVPKVLIANQTPILEAVCDPTGGWLPGVPVVAAYPFTATQGVNDDDSQLVFEFDAGPDQGQGLHQGQRRHQDRGLHVAGDPVAAAWEIAAVLSSPSVSVWAWHQRGGSGLSPDTIRVGPTMLADLVWPTGSLTEAVAALRSGDVVECGALVDAAYGLDEAQCAMCMRWWRPLFDKVMQRP